MSANMPDMITSKVENMGFARYMDFSRISTLYALMIGLDKSDLDAETRSYIYGAMDALMTVIGSTTELSRMLELDVPMDEILEQVMSDLSKRCKE